MPLPRADRLTEPPVPGRYYLVPCVRYYYAASVADWPVMGPRHDDKEHFDFPWQHYHIDSRFLTTRQLRRITGCCVDNNAAKTVAIMPMSDHENIRRRFGPLPTPRLVKRRCRSAGDAYPFAWSRKPGSLFRDLDDHFAGRQCAAGSVGWICPHKHFPLGSLAPDAHGVIVCPLHGLRIDARSGLVLPAPAAPNENSGRLTERQRGKAERPPPGQGAPAQARPQGGTAASEKS